MYQGAKNILVTGDLIRVDPKGIPNQKSNIQWLYHLISWQIRNVTKDIPVKCLLPQLSGDGFATNEFYAHCDRENCENSWIQLYDRTDVPQSAVDYFRRIFSANLVIGYELPDLFINLFKKIGVVYLDFAIHPLRYLDDIFFGVRTNCPKLFSRLTTRAMPVELYSIYAGLCKATVARMQARPKLASNSCLFVGQTEVDRSLIKNGHLLKLADFESQIRILAERFSTIYYKPHPYAKHQRAIFDLFPNTGKIKATDENIYCLLSGEEIEDVFTISSSVCMEARFFGKSAKAFFPDNLRRFHFDPEQPDQNSYVPLGNDFLLPQFWADILEPYFPTTNRANLQLPYKPSRLRTSLGCYWGYNTLDARILLQDVAPCLFEQKASDPKPKGFRSLIRNQLRLLLQR